MTVYGKTPSLKPVISPIDAAFCSKADHYFRKRALKRSNLSQIKAEMEIVYNVQGKADEGKIKF